MREELTQVSMAVARETTELERRLGGPGTSLMRLGKMMRPTLALLAARADGGRRRKGPVQLGVALELLHLATLVHDDLLDQAHVRHGLPTINHRLGDETAVLAGDHLFARAMAAMAGLPGQMVAEFAALITTLVSGELSQRDLGSSGTRNAGARGTGSLTVQDYLKTIAKKTASFTAASCRLGAMCAAADEPTLKALETFGFNLGMAFQIRDDVLDVVGNPVELQKPVGQDLRGGVLTLPVLYALSAPGRPQWLPALVEGFEPTEGNLALLREACAVTEGLATAISHAESYLKTATTALASLEKRPAVRALDALAKSLSVAISETGGRG